MTSDIEVLKLCLKLLWITNSDLTFSGIGFIARFRSSFDHFGQRLNSKV